MRPSVCTRPGSPASSHSTMAARAAGRRGDVDAWSRYARAMGPLNGCDAVGVALGAGGLRHDGPGRRAGEGGQHAPHETAVDGADHRMLGGGVAEGTVLLD